MKGENKLALFGLFSLINLLASTVNHIDDTDETYGYWEPLHYLIFGTHGMQTWEYSTQFALRTYAFIWPNVLLCKVISIVLGPLTKKMTFYAIRMMFGVFTAYAESRFSSAIMKVFNEERGLTVAVLICISPGIFLSSTSYLPSAQAMSLVMLSCSNWMEKRYIASIAFGSIAVCWTGWPFVALVFIPIGVHMLFTTFSSGSAVASSLKKISRFIAQGLLTLLAVAVPASLIDIWTYNKW